MVDFAEKIKILAVKLHTTPAGLARLSGQTSANLYNKIARNDFKYSELERLADAVGCKVEVNFVLPNGEKV